MIEFHEHLQPDDYPEFLKAWAAVDYRIDLLPTPVRDYWNPETCPLDALKFLAHAFSVDLWFDDWPEHRKRAVISDAIGMHRRKGTVSGLREYVALVDAGVIRVLTPSARSWVSAPISKEQRDAWLSRMPEIRIYHQDATGKAGQSAFVGRAVTDHAFATLDRADEIYGRRATLYQNGVEEPLKRAAVETVEAEKVAKISERVLTPGLAGKALFVGGFLPSRYATHLYKAPQIYTYTLDRTYSDQFSGLHLTTIIPSLEPLDTLYRRRSTTGQRGQSAFVGSFTRTSYLTASLAGQMLYDGVYLQDKSVDTPWVRAHSFTDVSRLGLPPYTAEVQIDAGAPARGSPMFAGSAFIGRGFVAASDLTRQKRAYAAVRANKSSRDRVLITTQTHRPTEFRDRIPMDGSRRFGDQVKFRI